MLEITVKITKETRVKTKEMTKCMIQQAVAKEFKFQNVKFQKSFDSFMAIEVFLTNLWAEPWKPWMVWKQIRIAKTQLKKTVRKVMDECDLANLVPVHP